MQDEILDEIPDKMSNKIITLTTDFGTQAPFVGSMKGVILKINPKARIIDISHQINPFDLLEAAFLISCVYKYFPKGTIHCIVVDPGVGSIRRPILAVSEQYRFVAPDNGVLSYIFEQEDVREVIHIKESKYFLDKVSWTFHGRDIFAPLSAWLTKGVDPKDIGSRINDYVRLSLPKPLVSEDGKRISGQIIHIDLFGNLITNIEYILIEKAIKKGVYGFKAKIGSMTVKSFCQSYSDLEKGDFGLIAGSQGYLELFAYQDSLARISGIKKGAEVEVILE